METVNMHEAKTHLSRLVKKAALGEASRWLRWQKLTDRQPPAGSKCTICRLNGHEPEARSRRTACPAAGSSLGGKHRTKSDTPVPKPLRRERPQCA